MQQKINQTQNKVQELLEWSKQEYANFMYNTGLDYLQAYLPEEGKYMLHCITSSRVFWNWWKLNWHYRDAAFIDCNIDVVSKEAATEIYKELHDAKTLAYAIYPNGVVLQETYAKMMGELQDFEIIKEEVAA